MLDLGDRAQAAVDVRVGADHLDLEAGHAALADLVERVRDAVHRRRRRRRRARRASARRSRVRELAPSRGRGTRRPGAYGMAAMQAANSAERGRRELAPASAIARSPPRAAAGARGSGARGARGRRARSRRTGAARAARARSCRRSTASSQARSSARASSGPRSQPIAPVRGVALASSRARPSAAPRRGRARAVARRGRARGRRAPSPRAPTWRREPCSPCALTRPPRRCARNSSGVAARRRLRPRAADVDARVVVGAADADAAVRLDVDRGRVVELRRARAVADLPDVEQLREPAPVARQQRRLDGVERVRQRAGDLVLVQVGRRRPRRRRRAPAATRGRPA